MIAKGFRDESQNLPCSDRLVSCGLCRLSIHTNRFFNCNDNVFSTGSDGESTLAIVVLLLELVLSLASLLLFFLPNFQLDDRVDAESRRPTSAFAFCINISDFSSSVPLRI